MSQLHIKSEFKTSWNMRWTRSAMSNALQTDFYNEKVSRTRKSRAESCRMSNDAWHGLSASGGKKKVRRKSLSAFWWSSMREGLGKLSAWLLGLHGEIASKIKETNRNKRCDRSCKVHSVLQRHNRKAIFAIPRRWWKLFVNRFARLAMSLKQTT